MAPEWRIIADALTEILRNSVFWTNDRQSGTFETWPRNRMAIRRTSVSPTIRPEHPVTTNQTVLGSLGSLNIVDAFGSRLDKRVIADRLTEIPQNSAF
jgi:hypothetical protein